MCGVGNRRERPDLEGGRVKRGRLQLNWGRVERPSWRGSWAFGFIIIIIFVVLVRERGYYLVWEDSGALGEYNRKGGRRRCSHNPSLPLSFLSLLNSLSLQSQPQERERERVFKEFKGIYSDPLPCTPIIPSLSPIILQISPNVSSLTTPQQQPTSHSATS